MATSVSIASNKFAAVKELLGLSGKDTLGKTDIAAILNLPLSYIYSVDAFSDYDEMRPIKEGDVFHGESGIFKRYLLNDYGNGRYRLSCTNHKRHKAMHKQGKCYSSSIWTKEQIELNGYKR